jgi:molecular chaperone GrpE
MPKHTDEEQDSVNTTKTGDETAADQAEAEGAAAAAQPDPVDAPLRELQRERDSLQERLLRTAAEFDNYRKRMERERREASEYAASDVLLELLPIVDNLERALQAAGSQADALRKGVEMIHKQMLDLLRKRRVVPIETLGVDFDPRFHQAVVHEPRLEEDLLSMNRIMSSSKFIFLLSNYSLIYELEYSCDVIILIYELVYSFCVMRVSSLKLSLIIHINYMMKIRELS